MTLERCVTQCTAEVIPGDQDEIWLAESHGGFSTPNPDYHRRIKQQLDRMRRWAGSEERFRGATPHNFPSAARPASSASGFAALTPATARALGRSDTSTAELSRLPPHSAS